MGEKRGKLEQDKIYCMRLDDYATPGYVSFDKNYYGTIDDISNFISKLDCSKYESTNISELIDSFKEYMRGNKDVEITVAYSKSKLLEEVTVIGQKSLTSEGFEWTHLNIWDCAYVMRCDSLCSKHYWVQNGNGFYRIIKADFENLRYEIHPENWSPISYTWGFPHMIEDGANALMVEEKRFETLQEMENDMKNFSSVSEMDFTQFCNDIFGDG